ncbi:hypothetical protein ACFB49_21970 [Sphingomonas sp. DBB INV C78]|uniref:DNA -binding domain-containing protein n=1 Tax=Sphingomonas sp. DBB INV C78 TaxID=3349434 RepID=UPI0036D3C06D
MSCETARLFWRAEHDPRVIRATAVRTRAGDAEGFRLEHFASMATLLVDPEGHEQLLLRDGQLSLRLDIEGDPILSGPVRLHLKIQGVSRLGQQLVAIRRLNRLLKYGYLPRSLFPALPRQARWRQVITTIDAINVGATQRETACALFGDACVRRDWNSGSGYLRTRVQRLVKVARHMLKGHHLDLLRLPETDRAS